MQVIEIESPFGADCPELCCPVCGTPLQLGELIIHPACGHVTYVFCDAVMEFDYLRPELDARLQERRAEERREDDARYDLDLVREFLADDVLTAEFRLTSSGMACGPAWHTNAIAVTWPLAQG